MATSDHDYEVPSGDSHADRISVGSETRDSGHQGGHPGLEGKQQRMCPFLHGTVRCDPFPGYVQGRQAAICPEGCKPTPPGVLDSESLSDRLEREALEFNTLFHAEKKLGNEAMRRRAAEIKAALATAGICNPSLV